MLVALHFWFIIFKSNIAVDLIEMHQMFPFTMVRTPSRDQFWYNFENSAQLQQNELFILDYSCPDGKNILEMVIFCIYNSAITNFILLFKFCFRQIKISFSVFHING